MPQVEVTFDIDANGILNVSAKDKATGKEQTVRIEASTGLSQDEIARMRSEAEANADSDKAAREQIEKLNAADSLIFQTEKQLKEFGEKVDADDKTKIEAALEQLRDAHKTQNMSAIEQSTTSLNEAWQAATQKMYAAGNAPGTDGMPNMGDMGDMGGQSGTNGNGATEDVTDVEFEEVDSKA